MGMTSYKIPTLKCLRCEHEWFPRKQEPPKLCPKCNSPYWDRPRKVKKDENPTSI